METYEDFKTRNAGFGSFGLASEKETRENYGIALEIEKKYNEEFGKIDGPRIGDTVEFSDGYSVYKNAKIVENLYGKSEHGMLCVCERGSSYTNGISFSTSGGAFKAFHKSRFVYIGEDTNIVWSFGCHGVGAHQGIYFPLKVRKWIIPYEPVQKASTVRINGRNAKGWDGREVSAVWVENFSEFYHAQSFSSVKAFRAWADYVGYKSSPFNGTFHRVSPQKVSRVYFWDKSEIPEGVKTLKLMDNGRIVDAYVKSDERNIIYLIPNPNILPPRPKFGTKEYDEEFEIQRKYYNNPLGV